MIVRAERVITSQDEQSDIDIHIKDGKIVSLQKSVKGTADFHAEIVVPGFVDAHCHGGNGFHFFDENLEAARNSAQYHLEHGTTSLLASFVAAQITDLKKQIDSLVMQLPLLNIVGIHLEGPYLSETYCGAHNPDFLSLPSVEEIKMLLRAGDKWIKMITIAPELEGAIESISYLSSQGVIAAIGHSDADDEITKSAIDAGASLVTHFYSAMRPIHHRIGGMTLTSLFDDRIFLELILDNVHIATNAIAIPLHFATDRVIGITDALAVSGKPDGDYTLGTTQVELRNGIAKIKGKDLLAGSTLTMDKSFRSAVTRLGMTSSQAVRAFSTRPAKILGLNRVGDIAKGLDADLALLNHDYELQKVIFKGSPV
jgi:N-acetylglucosamine-6-phosphate deacetylase